MTIAQFELDPVASSRVSAAMSAAAVLMVLAANRSAKGRPPGARDSKRGGAARGEIGSEDPHSNEIGAGEPARSPTTRKLPTGLY